MSNTNDTTDTSDIHDANEMAGSDLRLDGNSAAGLLADIFAFEMTSAQCTCAHCGGTGALGALLRYGGEMGTVLRCPTCEGVQLRIAAIRGQYVVDMRGMSTLRISIAAPQ